MRKISSLLTISITSILMLSGLIVLISANAVEAATFTVDTTADGDDGECVVDCTLREAIDLAADGDIIELAANTYQLTDGVITILDDVTVRGVSSSTTVIDGSRNDTVFRANGGNVYFEDLRITNGAANFGGGLRVNGSSQVTLTRVMMDDNVANFDGGAIYVSSGQLRIVSADVYSNTAGDDGAALFLAGSTDIAINEAGNLHNNYSDDDGGAVFVDRGLFLMTGGQLFDNDANQGGGLLVNTNGQAELSAGLIISNETRANDRSGGGVQTRGVFTMSGGSIISNVTPIGSTNFPGGGLSSQGTTYLQGGEIRQNQAYRGGGMVVDSGTVYLQGTNIVSNTAWYGGGVYIRSATAHLEHSAGMIAYNRSLSDEFGGGGLYIFLGSYNGSGGSFENNHANFDGGAVHNARGTFVADQLSFVGNNADNQGGGIQLNRGGEGLITVTNSTFDGNTPEAISAGSSGGDGWLIGNSFINHANVFEVNGNASAPLIVFANNITTYTVGVSGTVGDGSYYRHNWWGDSATEVGVGDTDAFDFRLGAAVVDWSTDGALADSGNGRSALIVPTTGTGTGIIISHGRGNADVIPFARGSVDTMCSDYYDFFVINGTGEWDVTIPIDGSAQCELNVAGGTAPTNIMYRFATDVNGAPDNSCVSDADCWVRINDATRSGSSGSYALTAPGLEAGTDLAGTPFTSGDSEGNGPTAVRLQMISSTAADQSLSTLVLVFTAMMLQTLLLMFSRNYLNRVQVAQEVRREDRKL